jgi:hypothetical protein
VLVVVNVPERRQHEVLVVVNVPERRQHEVLVVVNVPERTFRNVRPGTTTARSARCRKRA